MLLTAGNPRCGASGQRYGYTHELEYQAPMATDGRKGLRHMLRCMQDMEPMAPFGSVWHSATFSASQMGQGLAGPALGARGGAALQ